MNPDLSRKKNLTHWALLVALSAALAAVLEHLGLPAGLMLGPMLAAVLAMMAGVSLRLPNACFVAAQGLVGCLLARSIPATVFTTIGRDWPVFVVGVLAVVTVANGLGWLLARWQVLPGTIAIWGSAPGAATAMVLMSEDYGADVRLVACMQYLRVVCVSVVASVVARLSAHGTAAAPMVAIDWFPAVDPAALAATLAIAWGGAWAGWRLRLPAGTLLGPLLLGVAFQGAAGQPLVLPPWLLAGAYAAVGWSIGLRFTRPILAVAIRALPRVLASIFALIALCGGFAALLVAWTGIDPLTAYLATSPGGADSVAIIAASSQVDLPFVIAMQTLRLVFVMLTGPLIARFIAARLRRS
ncbi:AbrB family transcriptional regulator [Ramlibacter sp. H39-3-26]|uniref:AbrB family transcriptional regulator n=1 Tax=Curvibacter soli TaxID=3031331 RepID=UPI0023DB6AB9|nr:AbrB family transcriptional regulator [Ramlibacter sp. H39-3-26]MDF1484314.1 AbrB family transcriptional regulator [Ramlibacter sp. H39-3-26]